MYTGLLHTHKLSVILFLFIYLLKLTFLLLNQRTRLLRFNRWIRIPEMVISTLFLLTGVGMLFQIGRTSLWLWVKIGVVFLSIPVAVMGFRRFHKGLSILAVFLIVCAYGLAEMQQKMITKGPIPESVVLSPSSSSYDVLVHGEALYVANCANCHGPQGKLNLSGAKDLSQSTLDDPEIKHLIRNGKNAMPPYDHVYDDDEIQALTAYVKTLRNGQDVQN